MRHHAAARLTILLIGVVGAVLAWAAPASAHPFVLFTTPTADSAVAQSPSSVELVFNEPVSSGTDALVNADEQGRPVRVGAAAAAGDDRVVTAPILEQLPPGSYTVRWRVTGEDGDLVENEFRFAVGAALTELGGTSAGAGVSWLPAGLRIMLFAGLAVAFGGIVARRSIAVPLAENPALQPVRSWSGLGALAGLAAVLGLAVPLIVDTGLDLWTERPGRVLLVEAAGFAAAALLLWGGRHRWASVSLAVVIVAEGVRSHAGVAEPIWGALLTAVHLAAAVAWAGALLHIVRTAAAWRAHRPAVRWVISEYAGTALWLFLTVVATGTISALLLVPADTLTTTAYGRVLLGKISLVSVAAALALTARLTLGRHDNLLGRVRRLARTETVVLAAVLGMAATLVSTPLAGQDQLAPPPPAVGAVMPLGTLAGQIGVNVAASQGQLVVRLTTPRRGNYYGPDEGQDYQLSGRLSPTGVPVEDLDFRPCGPGCFVAATSWPSGENILTLRAGTPGWRGGDVALIVPWPVTPATDLLARTVATMQQADPFTIYETVTSDGAAALPEPQAIAMTGPAFLAGEPYGSGVAPIAVRFDRGGAVRLSVAFPAEGRTAELVLDEQGRIAEETLTDPKHLVLRRFVYSDSGP
ncbi:MAG: copper resistance protein CopC [Geodermatophilaceae bacterium]